jgi:aldehyde dehydrogenase (NAD+)
MVGKIIMQAASKYLTPVCLELGGKAPVFVHNDANIDIAAKRIVWGKFLNVGQSCKKKKYKKKRYCS